LLGKSQAVLRINYSQGAAKVEKPWGIELKDSNSDFFFACDLDFWRQVSSFF
jgi:hypothetical protein